MLTREHAIVVFENGQAIPDRLFQKQHARYLVLADQMLDIYRTGTLQTRRSLHRRIHSLFDQEMDCQPQRIDAFCKLLDDASEYKGIPSSQAAQLRIQVFQRASSLHPLVMRADRWFENQEMEAKNQIAADMGESWSCVENRLFGDLIEFHRLEKFNGFTSAAALLSRYNVAQTQAALFDAQRMRVIASDDFKSILRYAKLARLMHTIYRERAGVYRFDFDGPASLLNTTHRYGIAMARFIPGLLSCRGWQLSALLKPANWRGHVTLTLSSNSGLSSPVSAASDFDSSVESAFAAKWGTEPRDGWTLESETEILHSGQKTFIPDFVFRHGDGRQVLMEIIGFWTPEYLARKIDTLKAFQQHVILLAVAKSNDPFLTGLAQPVLSYKSAINVKCVLDMLEFLSRNHEQSLTLPLPPS